MINTKKLADDIITQVEDMEDIIGEMLKGTIMDLEVKNKDYLFKFNRNKGMMGVTDMKSGQRAYFADRPLRFMMDNFKMLPAYFDEIVMRTEKFKSDCEKSCKEMEKTISIYDDKLKKIKNKN